MSEWTAGDYALLIASAGTALGTLLGLGVPFIERRLQKRATWNEKRREELEDLLFGLFASYTRYAGDLTRVLNRARGKLSRSDANFADIAPELESLGNSDFWDKPAKMEVLSSRHGIDDCGFLSLTRQYVLSTPPSVEFKTEDQFAEFLRDFQAYQAQQVSVNNKIKEAAARLLANIEKRFD